MKYKVGHLDKKTKYFIENADTNIKCLSFNFLDVNVLLRRTQDGQIIFRNYLDRLAHLDSTQSLLPLHIWEF